MNFRLLLSLLLFATGHIQADTLYKCQTTDGKTIYTNQKNSKGCEIVSQERSASGHNPSQGASQKPRQPTPADFPRVNGDQQKARDNDRRAILEQELANEQKLLDAAKAEQPVNRDKLQLHERNLGSIRKELANLK
jgi:hypothetical protein